MKCHTCTHNSIVKWRCRSVGTIDSVITELAVIASALSPIPYRRTTLATTVRLTQHRCIMEERNQKRLKAIPPISYRDLSP